MLPALKNHKTGQIQLLCKLFMMKKYLVITESVELKVMLFVVLHSIKGLHYDTNKKN